jgi:hypothetical protein
VCRCGPACRGVRGAYGGRDDLSNVAAQNWLNLELFGEFNIASAPELNAFAIAVAGCPLLALLLSVELLNRALKRHRFQAATFHSSHILP